MEVDEIIYLTSLDKESATHTKERDFTEPFVIDGEIDMDSLKKDAQAEGLDIVKGKRFYHLISQGHSKAKAMLHVASLFEKHFAMKLIKIALGDSENDFSMLKSADVGILIPSYSGAYADINDETIIKAPFAGPRGWNEALLEVLDV